MKVITWNVNGIRTRLPRLLALLERHCPDLLCLQEVKSQASTFPAAEIEAAGYHFALLGQKSYNGVALLSPHPLYDVALGFAGDPIPQQARVISARVLGVKVVNLYVVNGQSLDSDAYPLKLAWLDALHAWVAESHRPAEPLMLCGDINIAPDDRDVYDPEIWRDRVLVSGPERGRLQALLDWGLSDLLRVHTGEAGIYSWWDYRAGAFPRNLGLRIDLMLGTAPLAARCTAVQVDREERKQSSGEGKPSDHAPVICQLSD